MGTRNDGGSWQNVGDIPVAGLSQQFRNVVINEADGFAYATVSNGVAKRSGNIVIPDDKTKPLAVTLAPANNANGVSLTPRLTITYDEFTSRVAGRILRVFDVSQPAVPVVTIDVATATQNGKAWSVNVPTPLAFNRTYFVVLDAGAFSDLFGNTSNGIVTNTAWRFTTKSAPTISALSPANAANNVAANTQLRVTFSEPVTAAAGKNLLVFLATNPTTPVASISATSGIVAGNQVSYSLPASLNLAASYFARFETQAFTTTDGGVFSPLSQSTDWTFTVRAAPTVTSLSPANNGTNVPVATTLAISFSENVTLDGSKKLFITNTAQPANPFVTINLSAGTTNGATSTFTLPSNLGFATTYNITFESGAFRSVDGASFSLLTTSGWQFTTVSPPDQNPPIITFTPDALTRGTAKVFSSTITDNVAVTGARLFYRSITSAANAKFDSTNLQLQNGKWEATVAENRFGAMGLEYFFTARDAANNIGRSPATGFHYSYISFPASATPVIPGALIGVGGNVGDWRMISIPHTLSDARIATVFSELGAEDKAKWRLVTYKSATAWDEFPQQFSSLEQGKGYFINARTPPASGINVDGATTPSYNKSNLFKLTLNPGWNQIGNPYTFKIVWSEVLTFNNNPAGIGASLKRYTGNYVDAPDLEVFEGAFVFNSGLSAVTLNIPITGTNAGGRTSHWSDDPTGQAWLVPITLTSGDNQNTFGGVGMHPQASRGVDDFDDFSPPTLGGDLQIKFAHPEHFAGATTRDVVPSSSNFVWKFNLVADGQTHVRLQWKSDFYLAGRELFLLDEDRGVLVNMQRQNSIMVNPKISKNFKVYFGEDVQKTMVARKHTLGDAFPNPTVDQVSISFGLSDHQASYLVVVEIFDAMGRKVKTLVDGTFIPGFYETSWNHSADGVSPGLYTYRMVVSGNQPEVLSGKLMIQR